MSDTITAEEYLRELARQARPNKYGARGETVDGFRFDSRAELARWGELLMLLAAGEIARLRHHPRYVIIPASAAGPDLHWEADAEYWDTKARRMVAEDTKGGRITQTAVFKIKARLFRERYPDYVLRIEER